MISDRRLYFDYAAGTPLDTHVREAMLPYMSETFGNPNSLHQFGREAAAAIDTARASIDNVLGISSAEILHRTIFVGSATEANNVAFRGAVRRMRERHGVEHPRIIISAIEHESVIDTARDLEQLGAELIITQVNRDGFVDVSAIEKALTHNTAIVSVMHANNVIGTIQPVSDVAKIVKEFRKKNDGEYPLLHTDAAQTGQYPSCNVEELGVDMLTLSAHKMYGPKGIGLLYVRNRELITPLVTGGKQEFGMHAGTQNVPAIIGFECALTLARHGYKKESEVLHALGLRLTAGLQEINPGIIVNGKEPRVAGIWNMYIPNVRAVDFIVQLDMAGIAVSVGSACKAHAARISHVFEAMGYTDERREGNVRFSLGRHTTEKKIDDAISRIRSILTAKK